MTTQAEPDSSTSALPDPFDPQRQASRQLAKPTVEGYTVVAFIGEGTYGDVWKAIHKESGTLDAIKRLHKQPDAQARGEARMLAALAAARGVVRLKKTQLDYEPYCYVMEFMQGGTLAELIDRTGKLPFPRAWEMFRELVEGLRYVHREGAVHCDIKPENILLDALGKPRLSDFGQARGHGPGGASLGTPFYMPPEQARLGLPDPRWDVYALGAVLYQMLTGNKPRHSLDLANELSLHSQSSTEVHNRLQRYAAHLDRVPELGELSGIDPGAVDLMKRCLANDFEARPKDAAEILSLVGKLERKRRQRSLLMFGGVGPAAALFAVGLLLLVGGFVLLNGFEKMWIGQVVDDNQAVASAIAQATKHRFSDQMTIVEKEAALWRDLFDGHAIDEPAFRERVRREIENTYKRHKAKLDGWHLTDADGKMLANYGDVGGQGEPKFEFDALNKQYGWRGWFNGRKDLSEVERKNFSADAAQQALMARRNELFFSAPYKRRVDGVWVMTISRRLTSPKGGPPLGVLCGQFRFEEFTSFIRHFEFANAYHQRRKVVIGNELGQAMYHPKLAEMYHAKNGDNADSKEDSNEGDEAPEVDAQSKDYDFFVSGAASSSSSQTDPWYATGGKEYFIGREIVALDGEQNETGSSAKKEDQQKLHVFVFHEKDQALHGVQRAKLTAFLLGISVLFIGGLFLVGNIWGMRRTLSREEVAENA